MATCLIDSPRNNDTSLCPSKERMRWDPTHFLKLRKSTIVTDSSTSKYAALFSWLTTKRGIYSTMEMTAAGFEYTGDGDRARCHECNLELGDWTADRKPFTRHAQESPDCPFVLKLLPRGTMIPPEPMVEATTCKTVPVHSEKTEQEVVPSQPHALVEVQTLKCGRTRSFAHWSSQAKPSPHQMIQAGFFSCNVGDRTICLYCNLICQQWTPHSDDPYEVHRKLSPKCPFILALQRASQPSNLIIVNEHRNNEQEHSQLSDEPYRWHEVVATAACNQNYISIPSREASFATWPKDNLPPVESLVRAGFFYTGSKSIVTCFYCNGSLQNWGANDNPTVEHARWFPHCSYAKQLCGEDLYRKIQETKRAQQDRARVNNPDGASNQSAEHSHRGGLNISDESMLSRLVAARLDLPASQRLLDAHFKSSVIKRCWEDQLRLKHDDFQDICDLLIACIILQKQIDHIGGKKRKHSHTKCDDE